MSFMGLSITADGSEIAAPGRGLMGHRKGLEAGAL